MWRRRWMGQLAEYSVKGREKAGLSDTDLESEFQRLLRLARMDTSPKYGYQEFMRMEIAQTMELREIRESFPDDYNRRPFSNVTFDFTFRPFWFLDHRLQLEYDQYAGRVPKASLQLNLRNMRGDNFSMNYRYRFNRDSDVVEYDQIKLNSNVKIWGPWSAGLGTIYDFEYRRSILQSADLIYQDQCWGIGLNYTKDRTDERIMITFSLFGLGQIYQYSNSRTFTE